MTTEEQNSESILACKIDYKCKLNCLRINVYKKPTWFDGWIEGNGKEDCEYYIENKTVSILNKMFD